LASTKKEYSLPPPWLPPKYEDADVNAIQAVTQGTADAGQQQRAMKWIVEQGCGTYDLGWHPSGDHEASFAAGRRFVGLAVVKMTKINLAALGKAKTNG
jgi:hypothetical protein